MQKVNKDNAAGLILKDKDADKAAYLSEKPFDIAEHTTLQEAGEAYEAVLQYAGSSFKRDAYDQRIADETQKGTYTYEGSHGSTNGMIDQPADVGGWQTYQSAPVPLDSDADGMPDAWEKEHGLNPNDASDASAYGLDTGYTNLEMYLNGLVNHLYPKL